MNLVNASLSQFLASGGYSKKNYLLHGEYSKREVQSSSLSLPPPLLFFFFFLKLGVIHFREHKVYILTETGVQKLPGPQKQLAR